MRQFYKIGVMNPVLRSTHDTVVSAVWALHRIEQNCWWNKKKFSVEDAADLIGVSKDDILSTYMTIPNLANIALPMDNRGNIDGSRVRTEALLVNPKDFDVHTGKKPYLRWVLAKTSWWGTGRSGLDPMRRIPVGLFMLIDAWSRLGLPQSPESFEAFCSMSSQDKLELIPWLQEKSMKSGTKRN